MQDYVTNREQMSVQLASMISPIDERLLGTMFIESWEDWSKLQFGTTRPTLLSNDDLTRRMVK